VNDQPWRPAHRVALAVIMLAGFAVRVAFVLIRQSKVVLTTGDAYWYHYQAKLVADGRGFLNPFSFYKDGVVTPGADHPPGFILLLAAADKLGIDSPQGQRYLMCVVGTITIGVVALLGRRVAGPRVALIAAGFAALYPNFWINDGMLMVETMFMLAIAVSLYFAYGVLRGAGRGEVIGLSIALAVAALVRPETLVLYPTLVVALLLARRDQPWRERLVRLGLAALVPVIAFAPWAAYNQTRFDHSVPVSTGAGQTLAVGNCDLTYSGAFLGFYNIGCLRPPQIDPPTDVDPSTRDRSYQRIARHYITHHVGDLPRVFTARVGRLWHVYQIDQGLRLDGFIEGRSGGPPGSSLVWVRTALYSYYLLVVLAVAGTVLLIRRKVPVYPLMAQVLLATFTAATTFGVTRYRAGAEIAIVVLAAVALDRLVAALKPRPAGEAAAVGVPG
jgi:4-amino-4-deoxy-L-arabinose transferase-like glycosyltransferase